MLNETSVKTKPKRGITTKDITRIAIFGSISALLYMFLRFPLPFFPSFLDLHFSNVPALIGGFAFGPISGAMIQIVKVALKFVIQGSSTGGIGDLADIIIGISYVVPAAIIYRKQKTFKGAIIGASIGSIIMVIVACLANRYFLIPFYGTVFPGGMDGILALVQKVNPNVVDVEWSLVLWALLPFNIIQVLLNTGISFVLYKKVHRLIQRFQF